MDLRAARYHGIDGTPSAPLPDNRVKIGKWLVLKFAEELTAVRRPVTDSGLMLGKLYGCKLDVLQLLVELVGRETGDKTCDDGPRRKRVELVALHFVFLFKAKLDPLGKVRVGEDVWKEGQRRCDRACTEAKCQLSEEGPGTGAARRFLAIDDVPERGTGPARDHWAKKEAAPQ
jgi:hypothetical protein